MSILLGGGWTLSERNILTAHVGRRRGGFVTVVGLGRLLLLRRLLLGGRSLLAWCVRIALAAALPALLGASEELESFNSYAELAVLTAVFFP